MECIERREIIAKSFDLMSNYLTALGDSSRQIIFMVLLDHIEGMRVGEIAELSHFTRPSVSHHLKILKEAGLVDMYEEGTKNFYFVNADIEKWEEIRNIINFVCESITDGSSSNDKVKL